MTRQTQVCFYPVLTEQHSSAFIRDWPIQVYLEYIIGLVTAISEMLDSIKDHEFLFHRVKCIPVRSHTGGEEESLVCIQVYYFVMSDLLFYICQNLCILTKDGKVRVHGPKNTRCKGDQQVSKTSSLYPDIFSPCSLQWGWTG